MFQGSPWGEGPPVPALDGVVGVGTASQRNMSCFFSAALRVTPAGLDVTGSSAGVFGRTLSKDVNILCDVGPALFRTGLCAQTKQGM